MVLYLQGLGKETKACCFSICAEIVLWFDSLSLMDIKAENGNRTSSHSHSWRRRGSSGARFGVLSSDGHRQDASERGHRSPLVMTN